MHILGLLLAVLTGATPCLPRASDGLVHPQDGPHLDFELRVQPDSVRLSVQLNLACADELVGLLREDISRLDPVEVEPLRETLLEFFSEAGQLSCDGVLLHGSPTQFDWTPADDERLPYYPRFGSRALTTLRFALDFPTAQTAETLAFAWSVYPPNLTVAETREDAPALEVRTRVIAYGTHQAFVLTPDQPNLFWTAPPPSERMQLLVVPGSEKTERTIQGQPLGLWLGLLLGCIGCALACLRNNLARRGWALGLAGLLLALGTGLNRSATNEITLDSEDAQAVFLALHQNLYRAFASTAEEEVYSALATAVEGDLLEDLYTALLGSLLDQEQGGARAEVEALRHTSIQIDGDSLGPRVFEAQARWQVDAAVHHFGHFHRRTTAFQARYTIALGPQGWKIQDYQPLSEKRLATSTNDPSLSASDDLDQDLGGQRR